MKLQAILRALTEGQMDKLMEVMTLHGWNVTEAIRNAYAEIVSV